MQKHVISACLIWLLLMGWAHAITQSASTQSTPTQSATTQSGSGYVLNKGTLSTATHRSQQGPFEIKALVGETGVGLHSNGQGPHQLISGLIQPNYDLIFKNDLE